MVTARLAAADGQARPGVWTAWADRWDGTPLGPVQITSLRYSAVLSGFGTASAELVVSESPLDLTDLLRLWSWRLWILYDNQPMFCGLPSAITDTSAATVSLALTELHGYLTRRVLDNAGGLSFSQVEQTTIAGQLAQPVLEVGMDLILDPGPGFRRDRAYTYLEGPYRSDLLTNLSGVEGGPEFRAEYRLEPATATPAAALHIAYPRVGTDQSGVALVVPGDALEPTLTYDGDQLRTRTFAVGDLPEGEEGDQPVHVTDRPQPFLPRLDRIDDWPGVILASTLADRADTNAGLYAAPVLTARASTTETDPPLGAYNLGDTVTILVTDALHPAGMAATGRIVGLEVNCDSGQVGWTVSVTQPPTFGRPTLTQRLDAVAASQGTTFRRAVLGGGATTPTTPTGPDPSIPGGILWHSENLTGDQSWTATAFTNSTNRWTTPTLTLASSRLLRVGYEGHCLTTFTTGTGRATFAICLDANTQWGSFLFRPVTATYAQYFAIEYLAAVGAGNHTFSLRAWLSDQTTTVTAQAGFRAYVEDLGPA